MIYKFRMISGDEDNFLRDYEIESDKTFLDFHNLIQSDLGFEPSMLASFFLADEHWNKGMELTLIDMQSDGAMAAIPMETVKLKELVKERRERLLYVYDIFSDRSLFLELIDMFEPKENEKYPRCSASLGEPPAQFSDDYGDVDGSDSGNEIKNLFNDFEEGLDSEDFSDDERDF